MSQDFITQILSLHNAEVDNQNLSKEEKDIVQKYIDQAFKNKTFISDICKLSKLSGFVSRVHYIPEMYYKYLNDEFGNEETAKIITKNLSNWIDTNPVKGDLISVFPESDRYRNNELYIYDGTNVEPLSFDRDEYGHLPSKYLIEDFNFQLDYWSKIEHNNIVWFSPINYDFTKPKVINDYCCIVTSNNINFVFVYDKGLDFGNFDIKRDVICGHANIDFIDYNMPFEISEKIIEALKNLRLKNIVVVYNNDNSKH